MGCDLVYVDSALVYHPVRPARWAISIHQQKKAMFNALLYKKHARLYRAKIQRRPPWHYYLATAGLAAAIAGIIAQEQPGGVVRAVDLAVVNRCLLPGEAKRNFKSHTAYCRNGRNIGADPAPGGILAPARRFKIQSFLFLGTFLPDE
jgi:hypothetical protein